MPAKWINRRRRARIYARDGWRCAYCLSDKDLTLDHLRPRAKGGSNVTTNLVTSCLSCNSRRGKRSLRSFCIAVAAYTQQDWRLVMARIKSCRYMSLPTTDMVENFLLKSC